MYMYDMYMHDMYMHVSILKAKFLQIKLIYVIPFSREHCHDLEFKLSVVKRIAL